MSTQSIPFLSPEQYLEIERAAEFRSEYINGHVFAMAGGTWNHACIASTTLSRLSEQLRGRPCAASGSDLRVFCPGHEVLTYPDVVVNCGAPHFLDKSHDTITDATVIVEVLSSSTKSYDRGEKFVFYRSLPSFSEYLLISQDKIFAEHYRRQLDGAWLLREFDSPTAEIELTSIGCRLLLGSLYERVEFET
jgi:Uma2 family endonuclease